MQHERKTTLQVQIEAISKYLQGIQKFYIRDFCMKIYPVLSSEQLYISLFTAIKRHVSVSRSKGLSLKQVGTELCIKAYAANQELGNRFRKLIEEQKQFLPKFEQSPATATTITQPKSNDQAGENKSSSSEGIVSKVSESLQNEKLLSKEFPLKDLTAQIQQKKQSASNLMKKKDFADSSVLKNNQCQSDEKDTSLCKTVSQPDKKSDSPERRPTYFIQRDKTVYEVRGSTVTQIKTASQQKIDSIPQKKKNQYERIFNLIEDPLTSARPVTQSPAKNPYFTSANSLQANQLLDPLKHFKPPQVLQRSYNKPKIVFEKFWVQQNAIKNLSQKNLCLCQKSCQNIVFNNEDAFYCIHCKNVFHTSCMKKNPHSRNCMICHLRLMIPNKLINEEIFVGVLRKGRKKHEINFKLGQKSIASIKSKKDKVKLQLRCFRIKAQTQSQPLFPDNCVISVNGRQLKQFKPLHKQSSLKYRRDEPLNLTKNYQIGDNKLVVSQYYGNSGNERIQPQDHLIGLYLVEEEALSETVDRIVHKNITSFKESNDLIWKAFDIGENWKAESDSLSNDDEIISCELVKIPLICALSSQKLNYPARGVLCNHFQCFDLKNYIMLIGSSLNPRWVCPICKSSCYELKIDCVLTEILKQYTGVDKAEILLFYKDGIYEVLDRDEDPIDLAGRKLNKSEPKSLIDLKIEENLKRDRQIQAQMQYIKLQQVEQKKNKRVLQLPPDDQIVNLLSDSQ